MHHTAASDVQSRMHSMHVRYGITLCSPMPSDREMAYMSQNIAKEPWTLQAKYVAVEKTKLMDTAIVISSIICKQLSQSAVSGAGQACA